MKRTKFLLLNLILLITFNACDQQEELIEPIEQKSAIEEILLKENSHLQNLVNHISSSPLKDGRTNSILDQVDFSKATKLYDSANQVTKYTFSMTEEDNISLRNFILTEPDFGEISGLVFTHTVDQNWLSTFDSFPSWDKFTGQFTISDLEGDVISQSQIVDGVSIEQESTSGRTASQTCVTTYVLVTETYNSYTDGVYSGTTTHSWIETRTNCYSSGGGGGSSGGPTLADGGLEPLPKREVLTPDDNLDPVGVSPTQTWADDLTILDDPGDKISDIQNYLKCFNLSQGASLTIYVDQPVPNSSKTWTWDGNDPDVGHTFITITQGKYTRSLGFYPDGGVVPKVSPSSTSILKDDSNHSFDVSVQLSISSSQLASIYNDITEANSTYNLNSYNCTDFAFDISSSGGLNLPDTNGSWPGGGGSNPGSLGQDLRSISSTADYTVNKSSGSAPSNTGACK